MNADVVADAYEMLHELSAECTCGLAFGCDAHPATWGALTESFLLEGRRLA